MIAAGTNSNTNKVTLGICWQKNAGSPAAGTSHAVSLCMIAPTGIEPWLEIPTGSAETWRGFHVTDQTLLDEEDALDGVI